LLFLLPLLLAYEAGVLWLGGAQPETLRNGADTWLRQGLEACGLREMYYAPVLVIVVFGAWSWQRRWDRPEGVLSVGFGMALESVSFALGLWALSRELPPLLDQLGIRLHIGPPDRTVGRIITFVGAGIYEEVLFRLLGCFFLDCFFTLLGIRGLLGAALVALTSSVLFSAAHHVGPYGEVLDKFVFLFRALAGLYFVLLYQLRGFGIAVGTHAFYDVLVGVLIVPSGP
jgi:hypothetical protein